MKVFVSWSGKLSQLVGSIVRKFLPCMIQDLDVFMSKHDIESGVRWGTSLANELDASSFGILCLTATNLQSPWLLFEAGALTKHIEGRACGLLAGELRPTDVAGPLAQFQHRSFSVDGMKALIEDINGRLSSPLTSDRIGLVFDKWWPDINSEYEEALTTIGDREGQPPQREDRDLLEEILRLSRLTSKSLHGQFAESSVSFADVLVRDIVAKLRPGPRDLLSNIRRLKNNGDDKSAQELAQQNPEDTAALADIGLAMWAGDKLMLPAFFQTFDPSN